MQDGNLSGGLGLEIVKLVQDVYLQTMSSTIMPVESMENSGTTTCWINMSDLVIVQQIRKKIDIHPALQSQLSGCIVIVT